MNRARAALDTNEAIRAQERARIVATIRARWPEPVDVPGGYVNPRTVADYIEEKGEDE